MQFPVYMTIGGYENKGRREGGKGELVLLPLVSLLYGIMESKEEGRKDSFTLSHVGLCWAELRWGAMEEGRVLMQEGCNREK